MESKKTVHDCFGELRTLLAEIPPRLTKITATDAAHKPEPKRWSIQEELGHLIDSAFNNDRRLVIGQLEESPVFPTYDGNRWVKIHNYQKRKWRDLIELWTLSNAQLLAAAESAPESIWSRKCTFEDAGATTMGFVLADYIEHMRHHLKKIGVVE